MMLYGAIFGCLSPILSVAAFLSYKSPFLSPKEEVSYEYILTIYANSICPDASCCFSFILQKQNVEKAKAALSSENLDGSTSATDNKQSDHLLMIIAYNKWSRILLEVINSRTHFLSFDSFQCL
jgi:ATP-dependent RNA helicase DHX29